MQEDESSSFDIAKYLEIIRRRRYIAIVVALAVLSLFTWGSIFWPKTFEASSTLYVEKGGNTLIQGADGSAAAEERLKNIRNMISSRSIIERVIKRLGLDATTKNEAQYEDLITKIQKNLNVNTKSGGERRDSDFFTISYRGGNPKIVLKFVETLISEFIHESILSQRTDAAGAYNFIDEQLRDYKKKLGEYDRATRAFRERNPGMVPVNEASPEGRLSYLNNQLMVLLSKYTDQYPEVIKVKNEIEELQKHIAQTSKGRSSAPYSGPRQMSDVDSEEWQKLQRDKTTYQRLYDDLLQKRESARLSKDLENTDTTTRFRVVDPPILPRMPIKPNRVKLIFVGFFFGLAAGIGAAVGLDTIDNSFKDDEKLQRELHIPVLASVPSIITDEDILAETRLDRKVYLAAAAYLCLIGVVLAGELMYRYMGVSTIFHF